MGGEFNVSGLHVLFWNRLQNNPLGMNTTNHLPYLTMHTDTTRQYF